MNSIQMMRDPLFYKTMQCMCAIPTIEMALRTIYYSGALLHNHYHQYQVRKLFVPDQHFTSSPFYKAPAFSSKLQENILNWEHKSCNRKQDEPSLTLKFANSDNKCQLDPELFKQYSVLYREMCESCENIDCLEMKIPNLNFSEKSVNLLVNYLEDRTNLDLGKLDKESLFNFHRLSSYLGISDLENRCMKQIVYHIEHSDEWEKWEKIDDTSEFITPENLKELNKLIIDTNTQKRNWLLDKFYEKYSTLRNEGVHAQSRFRVNLIGTLILGLASFHPIPAALGMAFLFTYNDKVTISDNLTAWSFNKFSSGVGIAQNKFEKTLQCVISNIIDVAKHILKTTGS